MESEPVRAALAGLAAEPSALRAIFLYYAAADKTSFAATSGTTQMETINLQEWHQLLRELKILGTCDSTVMQATKIFVQVRSTIIAMG
jgi:hypothetical protein